MNAADYESGLRTLSDAPFVDPRDEIWTGPPAPYHIDTANQYIWDEKTGNPVYVGTGLGTGVGNLISQQKYTQPASPNFSAVMPSVSYSPQFEALTSGQGKFFAPWSTGQATPAGLLNYQVPGGDLANVTYTGGNTNLFNTNTDGTASFSGNTNTDAQGNKWIMSNGQWIRADSDLGKILSAGDTPRFPLGHYDSNGMWVGSEGGGALEAGPNVIYGGGPLWDRWGDELDPIDDPNRVGGNRDAGRAILSALDGL